MQPASREPPPALEESPVGIEFAQVVAATAQMPKVVAKTASVHLPKMTPVLDLAAVAPPASILPDDRADDRADAAPARPPPGRSADEPPPSPEGEPHPEWDRLIARLREQGIADERVLAAMLDTPRHLFVEEALASRAYENNALPIGLGQTISQPYIVALMTQALLAGRSAPPAQVLEIGTGSGYQTAVLAPLVGRVYSIERIERLATRAGALRPALPLAIDLLQHRVLTLT